MLAFARAGSHVFDYGNNLRGEARDGGVRGRVRLPGLRPRVHPAALLPRDRAVPLGGALGRSGGHRRDRRASSAALPGRRAAAALARARAGAGRVPGAARADLLARPRRPRAGRARDQRARAVGPCLGAGRDRPRPPRRGLGRLALPRDRGDARTAPTRSPTGRSSTRCSTSPRARRGSRVHHGGGVGIGNSIHAGMVVRRRRHRPTRPTGSSGCSRPTPAPGVMRHADAGYDEALDAARETGLDLPSAPT